MPLKLSGQQFPGTVEGRFQGGRSSHKARLSVSSLAATPHTSDCAMVRESSRVLSGREQRVTRPERAATTELAMTYRAARWLPDQGIRDVSQYTPDLVRFSLPLSFSETGSGKHGRRCPVRSAVTYATSVAPRPRSATGLFRRLFSVMTR